MKVHITWWNSKFEMIQILLYKTKGQCCSITEHTLLFHAFLELLLHHLFGQLYLFVLLLLSSASLHLLDFHQLLSLALNQGHPFIYLLVSQLYNFLK